MKTTMRKVQKKEEVMFVASFYRKGRGTVLIGHGMFGTKLSNFKSEETCRAVLTEIANTVLTYRRELRRISLFLDIKRSSPKAQEFFIGDFRLDMPSTWFGDCKGEFHFPKGVK